MGSPRARKSKDGSEVAQKLLAALNVVAKAQDKGGHAGEQHCRIAEGWLLGANGKLSIGVKIDDIFTANPNTEQLMKALAKTKENIVFTAQDDSLLHIRSGKFAVNIQCVPDHLIPTVVPDPPCAKISDKLLEALTVCGEVADDTLDAPIFRGVYLDGYSCAACDRHSIIQFWHGIHLPSGAIIPKFAIKAMNARDSKLTEFGFSDRTITFWYEDGGFIQTILFDGTFPQYEKVLNQPYNYQPIPADFFPGLSTIMDFAKDETIYFYQGKLSTSMHDDDKSGATYEVPGISKGRIYNGNRLKLLEKYAKVADLYAEKGAAFKGENCRGIIARRA